VLLVIAMVVIGILYIIQTNRIAVHGFRMKELETQLFSLKEENENLKLESTELQSTQNMKEQLGTLNLIPVDHVEYITPLDSRVAKE
jgi:hypothetical protein